MALRREGALQGGGTRDEYLGAGAVRGWRARGRACPGTPRRDSARISLSFWARPEAAGPSRNDCGRVHWELIRKRRKPRGPDSTCHREADVERRQREKESKRPESRESPAAPRAIIKM